MPQSEEVILPVVLVTGSRRRSEGVREALHAVLDDLGPFEMVVGCARGADAVASAWAKAASEHGVKLTTFVADWKTLRKSAGPERNRRMVQYVSSRGENSVCLAFPCPDSKGTWDCVREASAKGIPTIVRPIGVGNGSR